ncbi:uncharacterized protein BX663DRAFT_503277 [Cokeromyces recurvatus]|uniref:uncharacterized protein n=1 Tax=Cokeromyces recurvatus TaxID=90255 RepID=UPI00221FF4B6|nr:uncharacterized protein BX663DRAFT_503277 [Cokeromyces recurvatus]KAI7904717.1 hypothetical protein BX663DRAFT_503277 [Cokeromyces recurvatus]
MSQEVKHEILSEVNSQSIPTNISESQINSLTEAAKNLSNALKQTTTLTDFAQQTLIDVNSQPLIHNLMDNHPLISHPTLATTQNNQTLLNANNQLLSQTLSSNNSSNSISTENNTNNNNENNSSGTVQLDPSSPIITEFYERFAMGRMFQTLEELRTEAYEYGRKYNVALTTSKSDKTKIYLICKHGGHYRKNTKRPQTNKTIKPRIRRSQKTGCACMIYARCCRGSFWIIRKSIGEHNHPIAEDPRTYAMYRSLSPEHLLIVHRLLREHVGVSFIVKSLKANGVTNILAKDIENIQQDLKRRDVLDLPNTTESSSTLMTTIGNNNEPMVHTNTSTATIGTSVISTNHTETLTLNTSRKTKPPPVVIMASSPNLSTTPNMSLPPTMTSNNETAN